MQGVEVKRKLKEKNSPFQVSLFMWIAFPTIRATFWNQFLNLCCLALLFSMSFERKLHAPRGSDVIYSKLFKVSVSGPERTSEVIEAL